MHFKEIETKYSADKIDIQKFIDLGYDHIYIHQIGPHQAEFFQFYEKNILPKLL